MSPTLSHIPTNPALFPRADARDRIDEAVSERLGAALGGLASRPVMPGADMSKFRQWLDGFDFEAARPLVDLAEDVIGFLETGLVQMGHPGYMGLFNPAPTHPAEIADRIVAAFNPQICVWSHAPVPVEIEAHAIAALCRRIGFETGAGGHFTTGGSEANATAWLCALTQAEPDFAERGAAGLEGRPCLYVSAESHLAWLKIAHQSGVGREAVRLIATDGTGRMSSRALEERIQADLEAGDRPVMIAATAGTTNAGMVDPLPECAAIARAHGLWFHVDAAWGGALIASERERHVLSGIEGADSVTIDAHKWFATTMGAGMYLTRRPDTLSETFRVSASYMPSHDTQRDLYLNSFQCSRRFIGLRLFLALGTVGWEGMPVTSNAGSR